MIYLYPLSIGSQFFTSQVCFNYIVQLESRVTMLDLICISMHDIDVIIDMDWLSLNNALLGCSQKIISLLVHTLQFEYKIELSYLD